MPAAATPASSVDHDPPVAKYKGEPTGTAANDHARVILSQAERVSKSQVALEGTVGP
jgi:hypothetical protein